MKEVIPTLDGLPAPPSGKVPVDVNLLFPGVKQAYGGPLCDKMLAAGELSKSWYYRRGSARGWAVCHTIGLATEVGWTCLCKEGSVAVRYGTAASNELSVKAAYSGLLRSAESYGRGQSWVAI